MKNSSDEGKADEVLDNVNMRLRKIEERGE